MSRIAAICRRFVKPLAFSNGWAELAFRVPPPFVPSSLIASWLAKGPPGMDWVACSSVVAFSGPRSVWIAPWLTMTTAMTTHRGSRIRTTPRTRSTQKLPMVADRRRARPRIRATATVRPTAAETKFCTARPGHLREVAHRVLAGVVLPVRVGHEAHGGVEGEGLGHRPDVGRVDGQRSLEALEGVDDEDGHATEGEQRVGVGAPALLAVRVDAAEAVERSLDLQEHPVAERPARRRRRRRRRTGRAGGCPTAMQATRASSWSQRGAGHVRTARGRSARRRGRPR